MTLDLSFLIVNKMHAVRSSLSVTYNYVWTFCVICWHNTPPFILISTFRVSKLLTSHEDSGELSSNGLPLQYTAISAASTPSRVATIFLISAATSPPPPRHIQYVQHPTTNEQLHDCLQQIKNECIQNFCTNHYIVNFELIIPLGNYKRC